MRENQIQLLDLAIRQGGYFTTAQATALGISKSWHGELVRSGQWIKEDHGLYRLAAVPSTPMGELHLIILWALDKDKKNYSPSLSQPAIAYESVLSLLGLSDLMPSKIHVSVPPGFRRSRIPPVVSIHREERAEADLRVYEGLIIVRPLVAIMDLIREERVSGEHIEEAFLQGVRKGLITDLDIDSSRATDREKRLFSAWSKRS